MIAALALLLAGGALAADPLSAVLQEQAARGWRERDRLVRAGKPFPLAALVYGRDDGEGNRLEVYALLKERAFLIWAHPGASERLELDAGELGRGRPDLLGKDVRVIAYRSELPALRASTLHVLAARGLKVEKAGEFPEGRLELLEGGPVIASREQPLGRFLSVGCEDFRATARSAFKTTLHAPRKGRFVDVSASRPAFYAAEIARKEAALDELKGDLPRHAGEYLGLALSLYFDYAARGQARRGWERQREYFSLPAYAPPSMRSCMASMRRELRERLRIPAGWP